MNNRRCPGSGRRLAGAFALLTFGGCNAVVGIEEAVVVGSDAPVAGGAGDSSGNSGLGGAGSAGGGGMSGAPDAGSAAGAAGMAGAGALNCTTPLLACAGNCVNVATDSAHCGECDYACGAGLACTQGACAPQTVVSGVIAPIAFGLDATSLYFGSALTDAAGAVPLAVRKVPREGGGTITDVTPGVFCRLRTLVVMNDGKRVIGNIDSCTLPQGNPAVGSNAIAHFTDAGFLQQLVVIDGWYWSASFDGSTSLLRRVTPPATTFETFTSQTGRVDSLAVEGTGNGAVVYWVNRDASAGAKSGLWRRAEGGPDVPLVPGGQMRQLILGADGIYVADVQSGIGKTAKDVAQTALTPIVSPNEAGGAVQGLALANGKLYWLTRSAGGQLELHRRDLDGTGSRVLGRVSAKQPVYWNEPIGASQLTVNGGFVYFADPGTVTGDTSASNPGLSGVTGAADGTIFRLPQ
jgi:Stigma-specific protein, Stig1